MRQISVRNPRHSGGPVLRFAAALPILLSLAATSAWAIQPAAPTPAAKAPEPAVKAAPGDPLASLAADVAVIFNIETKPRLLLMESDHGVANMRMLDLGEEYRDGWKIKAVSRTIVTLEKGADKRDVTLTGRTQVVSEEPPPAVLADRTAPPRPAVPYTLAEAMAAKSVYRIMRAGGSAKDVATAMAAAGATAGGKPIDPNTAAFVKSPTGVTGISMRSESGATLTLFGADFDGYLPPDMSGYLPYAQDVADSTANLYPGAPISYPNLGAAIAANDIGGIVANGGSAADVARAAMANGIQGGSAPLDPSTALFIRSAYGDYGLRVTSTSGAYVTMWGSQISGYVPPLGPDSVAQDMSVIRYPMPGKVDTRIMPTPLPGTVAIPRP